VNIFHVIQKQNGEEVYAETLSKYVQMKYMVVEKNRDNDHQHEFVEVKKDLPYKMCELEDFGEDLEEA
jgi:hypothetical protein